MSNEFFDTWSKDLDQRAVDQSSLVQQVESEQQVKVNEKRDQTRQKLAQSEQGLIPAGDYDYADREIQSEKNGVPRDEGWYENQYYKHNKRVVMGHDIGSGAKIYSELDESNDTVNYQVRQGVSDIQKGRSSEEGPDDVSMKGLSRLATAARMDGSQDYQEFAQQVRSMGYPEASVQAAWNVGTRTTQRYELQGALDQSATPEEEAEVAAAPEPDLTTQDLYSDENWMAASKILYQAEEGEEFQGTEDDLIEWSINEMSNFNWRTTDMAYYAIQANSRKGDYAQALGYLVNTYDRVDTDFNIFKKSVGAFATDPTNFIGFGGGFVASRMASAVAKNRLKKFLGSTVGQTAVAGGFEGALFGGAEDAARQTVDIAAGNQEEYNVGQTAVMAAGTAVAGATVGGTLALALSDPARELYKRAGRNMLNNAKASRPTPRWSRASQQGYIGFEPQTKYPESEKAASLEGAFDTAGRESFKTNRELKVRLQDRVKAAAADEGIDLSADNVETHDYLSSMVVRDAQTALKENSNAIGWYDKTVGEAMDVLGEVHPEIKEDPLKRFAFTYAMAVTSNGLKVNKNFELAEKAYNIYKETGVMPSDIGTGTAASAINKSLAQFNEWSDELGTEGLMELMSNTYTVRELKNAGFNITGELMDTEVPGAAILGPKIGGGFFSNLQGKFDQLTMDRWLMRSWGRLTGTLIEERPDMVKAKADDIRSTIREFKSANPEAVKAFEDVIGTKLRIGDPESMASAIQKASMLPANRKIMNETPEGERMRKLGNALAKYLDGQKEAPTTRERGKIRAIFKSALDNLHSQGYEDLTMADLQALLWYPEKRLYDKAKGAGDVAESYADDEAPDYANAASALAEAAGIPVERIAEIRNARRTAGTRPGSDDAATQAKGGGGEETTGKQKEKTKTEKVVTGGVIDQGGHVGANPVSAMRAVDSGPESPAWKEAAAKGLDMSEPARMQRAKDMGFDTDTVVYHGTETDFEAFDPERAIGTQFWSTTNKGAIEAGEVGAQGKGVIKAMYVRMENPAGWDEYDRFGIGELIARGYDGLKLPDGDGNYTVVAFDPSQYRDVKAAFDPDSKSSANLLKSLTGAAAIGAAAEKDESDAV